MQNENRRWQWLSPEIVILVMIPTVAAIAIFSFGLLDRRAIASSFWLSLLYVRFFGWHIFHFIFYVGLGYFVFSAIVRLAHRVRPQRGAAAETSPGATRSVERFRVSANFVWLGVMYAYALVVNVLALNTLAFQRPERVAWADELLMRVDHMLFGTFVPFELHRHALFNWLATPMILSYLWLAYVLSVVLIALFVCRPDRFRQFVLAFVVLMSLGLPTWAALPAVTPSEAYRTVKVRSQVPYDVALEIAGPIIHLENRMVSFLHGIERVQSNPDVGSYLISSFPSLHVAWGLLVVWFGVGLFRRSAILLLPWGLLNCVGAIYSLQHYAIDAVGGIVAAVLAVYLVRGLLALEARLGLKAPEGYGLYKSMQKDVLAVGHALLPTVKEKLIQAKTRNQPGSRQDDSADVPSCSRFGRFAHSILPMGRTKKN
jgi:membrane-associated phospholipid phosphatase